MSSVYVQPGLFERYCPACDAVKPLDAFSFNNTKRGYLRRECKECCKVHRRAWYEENRQRCLDYAKTYIEEHAETVKSRTSRYQKEKLRRDSEYRERNRQRSRAWAREHPGAWQRWAEPHRERLRAQVSAYVKANPLKNREWTSRRRARERALAIGRVDYAAILARDGYWCYLCRQEVLPGQVNFDHVIPLSRGGPHSMDNIKVTHAACNARKWAKLPQNTLEHHGVIPALGKPAPPAQNPVPPATPQTTPR